ncbi:hypothetical protein ACFXD5_14895 [Streptomyces sp. NPDC059385]|uniref:hypothetical protein n=1 Tax=Streptomyces sp. NPDC059385 TaxID=3346817 RepID=UPI00369C995C
MAVLTTISVVVGAWCAAGIVTAVLYAVVRGRRVRRQRAMAAALEGPAGSAARTPAAVAVEVTAAGHDAETEVPAQAARPEPAARDVGPVGPTGPTGPTGPAEPAQAEV